jgi:hypothetical protein
VKDQDKEQDLCSVSQLKSEVSPECTFCLEDKNYLSLYEFALMLREGSQAMCIIDKSEQLLHSYETSE